MKIKTTISIIVPTYNVENYVSEALDSIVRQSVPPHEVIIIDDGSSDSTGKILENYRYQPNWIILRTRNNGPGQARNLGRELATGEYIYFFDSDDLLECNFIARMRQIIAQSDMPDLVMFSGKSFFDDGFEHPFFPNYSRTVLGSFEKTDGLITKMFRNNASLASPCLYISRAFLWAKYRLAFPSTLHEDEAVLYPLLAISEKTVVRPEVFFLRRIRANSLMTRGKDVRNVTGILRALNETSEFMARHPDLVMQDIAAWRGRISRFGVRYVTLCKITRTHVSWRDVLGSLITARSLSYSCRLIVVFLPAAVQEMLRKLKRRVKCSNVNEKNTNRLGTKGTSGSVNLQNS